MIKKLFACAMLTLALCLGASAQKLTVKVDKPTIEMSPLLYGAFFEDIHRSADGGLNSNMILNHSFEYYPFRCYDTGHPESLELDPLTGWEECSQDGGKGRIFVTGAYKLAPNNDRNLTILCDDGTGFYGAANLGYDGISVKAGEKYDLSFHTMVKTNAKDHNKSLKAVLLSSKGEVLDQHEWSDSEMSVNWKKYTCTFTPKATDKQAKLAILYHGKCWSWLDMVFLTPAETYHGHGLRKDIAEAIAGLNPAFLRFPGGCIVHGSEGSNIYNWKETVGPVENRKTNWSRWGYFQSCTIGYYEYFVFCEDMGCEPLPVVPVGVTCGFEHLEATPMEDLHILIDDALDVVEFANGGVDTKWGKVRAEMGHPAPFNLKYIGLGNEEHDNALVRERFPLFVKAFNEKYPEIKLVGTSGLDHVIPLYDMMCETKVWASDEHYYPAATWFAENQHRFDNWDRNLPKVYVGEYAPKEWTVKGCRLFNACCEAAFLTGCERNSDICVMTSYAPLAARFESKVPIYFDNDCVVLEPTYYMQSLFSYNKGTQYLSNTTANWPKDDKLAISTTYDEPSGDVIIKIVNLLEKEVPVTIALDGVKKVSPKGKRTIIAGDKDAYNTKEEPTKIAPVSTDIKTAKSFKVAAPSFSIQVIRTHVEK